MSFYKNSNFGNNRDPCIGHLLIDSDSHEAVWKWRRVKEKSRYFVAPKASAEGACIFIEFGYYRACMMGYCGIWVLRACANFIRGGNTFGG